MIPDAIVPSNEKYMSGTEHLRRRRWRGKIDSKEAGAFRDVHNPSRIWHGVAAFQVPDAVNIAQLPTDRRHGGDLKAD
jgi:hypothetical protein